MAMKLRPAMRRILVLPRPYSSISASFKMLPFDIRRPSRNAQPSLSKLQRQSNNTKALTATNRFGCFRIFRRVRFALACRTGPVSFIRRFEPDVYFYKTFSACIVLAELHHSKAVIPANESRCVAGKSRPEE